MRVGNRMDPVRLSLAVTQVTILMMKEFSDHPYCCCCFLFLAHPFSPFFFLVVDVVTGDVCCDGVLCMYMSKYSLVVAQSLHIV